MYNPIKSNIATEAVQTFLDEGVDEVLTSRVEQLAAQSDTLDEFTSKLTELIHQEFPLNDIENSIYSMLLKQVISYVYWRTIAKPYWEVFHQHDDEII
jgi:hypothetical protein